MLVMYLSGLNGSCLGSVNTHGTGMYAASAGAGAARHSSSSAAQSHRLARRAAERESTESGEEVKRERSIGVLSQAGVGWIIWQRRTNAAE